MFIVSTVVIYLLLVWCAWALVHGAAMQEREARLRNLEYLRRHCQCGENKQPCDDCLFQADAWD